MEQQQHDDVVCPAISYPEEEPGSFVETAEIKKSSGHPSSFNFEGINIKFPYEEAYPCQENLMEAIIQALNATQNCLLESPTGTGKTAALLCSVLAWQQQKETELESSPKKRIKTQEDPNGTQEPSQVPKVIYATRTLKHIDQIIDQLAQTSYSNTAMTILTSMKHSCNNEFFYPHRPDAPGPTDNADPDEHFCQYNSERLAWNKHLISGQREEKPWKILELKKFCRNTKTCPYFELLHTLKGAQIIFCTYSYLLNANMKKALDLQLKDNILIFDEGHNVEDVCYQISSTPEGFLTSRNLSKFASILESDLNSKASREQKESLGVLTKDLRSFRDSISEWFYNQKATDFDGNLKSVRIFLNDFHDLSSGLGGKEVRQSYENLTSRPDPTELYKGGFKVNRAALRFVGDLLRVLEFFGEDYLVYGKKFRIFLIPETDQNISTLLPRNLKFDVRILCMDPEVAFKHMDVARSVIITSGTLSPMKSFTSQLGIEFKRQRSECHIVSPKRVFCKLINMYEAGSKTLLDFKSANTESNEPLWEILQDQLAKIIIDIYNSVKKGVVVFLKSESLAWKLSRNWERNKNWLAIDDVKKIFFEKKGMNPDEVKKMLDDYRALAETSGA
ncbi:unnamed protein product, partial [Allacma fusca]